MSGNLPPGCRESDIPGNRPWDIAFERFCDSNIEELYQEWEGKKCFDDAEKEFAKNEHFENYVCDCFESDFYDR